MLKARSFCWVVTLVNEGHLLVSKRRVTLMEILCNEPPFCGMVGRNGALIPNHREFLAKNHVEYPSLARVPNSPVSQ